MNSVLVIDSLNAGYGKRQVLYAVDARLDQGEIVAVIGPNGAGKSTLLRTICGLVEPWSGEIRFNGERLTTCTAKCLLGSELAVVSDRAKVFQQLTTAENLDMGGYRATRKDLCERREAVLDIFPALRTHLRSMAGTLSGGEQQMLAVARALISRPRLLLLDEPSHGLSFPLVQRLFSTLRDLNHQFGISMLIVEHRVREVLAISNRVYVLRLGRIAFSGRADIVMNSPETLKAAFL